MEGNNVTIPLMEYRRLIALDAKVQSLIAYVSCEKYSIDRGLIFGMLGFSVNTWRGADGTGKPDGEQQPMEQIGG